MSAHQTAGIAAMIVASGFIILAGAIAAGAPTMPASICVGIGFGIASVIVGIMEYVRYKIGPQMDP